ncbi:hypothetical protein ABMA28_014387 [Loxostege sticticalis]|uniref:FAM86 N-terminal domain-containing protein n=1 Tax=Loxostege sticticalis TaxID=481309 RepID=A0ABD0TGM2_LOXSC
MLPLDNDECNIISTLIRKFYRGSLDYSIDSQDLLQITWSKQEEFLNATVKNPLIKRYPVKSEFGRLFFKKLLTLLEGSQEVHDDIYENLCTFMNTSPENFCYRHYIIGDGLNNIITLKETNNMVVNGTTGLRTWEAGIMLADWALCNMDLIEKKKVLELGSGVGLAGITIAKFCQPQHITLSDCHNDVLNALEENVAINFPSLQRQLKADSILFQSSEQTIEVMNLDWNDTSNISNEINPDIIFGSDIIYDPTIIEPLCDVLNTFCNRNENAQVFIAGVIRNEETLNMFLQRLDKMNLQYQRTAHSENVFIEWDLKMQRYLLKINKIS